MGLLCFHCEEVIEGGVKELFAHFRTYSLLKGSCFGTVAVCRQDGCQRTFQQSFSFKRHLIKQHRQLDHIVEEVNLVGGELPEGEEEESDDDDNVQDNVQDGDDGQDELLEFSEDDLKERSVMLVCKLKASSSVTQSTVSTVVEDVSQLFEDAVSNLQESTQKFLRDHNVDMGGEAALRLMDQFEMFQKPFHGIETEYKQLQYLIASKKFVTPLEKEITLGYAPRTAPLTGDVLQIPTPRGFHYVPIKENMKMIVETPGFWDCVQEHPKITDGTIRDFQDGEHCRSHPVLYGDDCSQIILYNDDVEMTNPLSPKAGTHKLGALYYTIKNVHPRHLSTLNHFYLAALYKSPDVAEFGFDVVLRPLVDDLKELEEFGLKVNSQGKIGAIKVGLAQVVGDNLGIHSLFGFAQAFTANLLCRKCKSHRDDLRRQTQLSGVLRTKENYVEDLEQQDWPRTGIRTHCILNELQCFHVISNYAPDIMHDLLEGVCALEVKLVLHHLISSGSFDLETLNARIMSFNYGFSDSSNRPCLCKWSSLVNADGAPGQNAAQMWALMRNIGVMMGDLVAEGDDYWELILLCECMDIIFSPVTSAGECAFMKQLISDHHDLYLELYPDRRLKPKHHFMLHYPDAALKIGPLVHYWSMRFEAKHNFFRRLSHIICNFKNITKSMAYRHQMFQCYQILSKQSFRDASCEIGPGSCLLLNSLPDCHTLSQLLGSYPLFADIFVAKWAVVYGVKYRKGMIVVCDISIDGDPLYGQIREVLCLRDAVHLVLEKWQTLYFKRHYHAYAVRLSEPNEIAISTIDDLVDHHPLHAVRSYVPNDAHYYISPRYKL